MARIFHCECKGKRHFPKKSFSSNCCTNSIHPCNHCHSSQFNIGQVKNSLFEVENFLCQFKNVVKGIKLYHIMK